MSATKTREATSERFFTNNDFLRIPAFLFRTLGLSVVEEPHGLAKRKLNFIFYLMYINLNIGICGEMAYLVINFESFEDFFEVTAFLSYVLFSVLSEIKVWFIFKNRELLYSIMSRLDNLFPSKDHAQQANYSVEKYFKLTNRTVPPLTIYLFCGVWVFNLVPLGISLQEYRTTGVFVRRLPFMIWYPFDSHHPNIFPLIFLHQILAGYASAISILSSDLTLSYMSTQLCMQFDGISETLLQMKPTGSLKDIAELKKVLKHHAHVIRIAKEINIIFQVSVFANLLASSGIICFVGFQIKEGASTIDIIKFIILGFFELVQVLLISYMGNILKEKSSFVGDNAYAQDWLDGSNSYKKMLISVIKRSQKPSVIRGLTSESVDLADFRNVMYNAYRFFALINTMYERKK